MPSPNATFYTDVLEGCEPLTVTFYNPSSSTNCLWQVGGQTINDCDSFAYTFDNAGSYDVSLTVTFTNGCSNSNTIQNYIDVHPNPVASFKSNPLKPDENDPEVEFYDLSEGNIAMWSWTFHDRNFDGILGGANEQDPIFVYPDSGYYPVELLVTTDHGCQDDTIDYIQIFPVPSIFIPNAFTPGGDGLNDFFTAQGENILEFQMMIFDRWGEVIFVTEDIEKGWDGKFNGNLVEQEVYVYKIDYELVNRLPAQAVGHVTVVR